MPEPTFDPSAMAAHPSDAAPAAAPDAAPDGGRARAAVPDAPAALRRSWSSGTAWSASGSWRSWPSAG